MRIAMIATARPTFAVDVAEARARAARELLTELGAEVVGPTELVMTPEDVEAARPSLAGADQVVHVCASFSDAGPAVALYADLDQPVLLWAFREPGPVGDRLWLNSLCGANLFGHALARLGRQARLVYGEVDEPAVRQTWEQVLAGQLPPAPELPTAVRERGDAGAAEQALARLQGRTIGVVGEAPPGFTPSEYDPALLERYFGLRTQPLTVAEVFARIDAVPAERAQAEVVAATTAQPSLAAVDAEQVAGSAAVTTALRDWIGDDQLDSVAVRCWPEFPTQRGVCPCSSLSRVADDGIPTQCERDVYGAATMLLLGELGAGMTYLADTVDLEADRNLVRFWHCGAAATELAADPAEATQYVHCNRKLGVAGNFPLRTGPVIAARLTEDNDTGGLRLLIASGTSIPAPNRFQGNSADVVLDADATGFINGLVAGGFPHHTVLAWTDVRPGLRAAADHLRIPVTEW